MLVMEIMLKYFTIEDAEKLLPYVSKKMRRLMKLKEAISTLNEIEITYEKADYENYLNSLKVNKEFHRLSSIFYKELEELERKGCFVKDIDDGVVDFLSVFEDREVFLCLQIGETKIRHWHELEDGFESRNPVIDLSDFVDISE